MNVRSKTVWTLSAVAGIALAAACGGGSSNAGNPGSPSGGGGGSSNPATTITITSAGVNPRTLTVARGTQVTFVNNDTRSHEMASDPHPAHGSCPEIETGVGFIQPNQSKQTGNLNTIRTCTYHDHNRDTDTTLQGSIVVQ
jgi:plastocyanin